MKKFLCFLTILALLFTVGCEKVTEKGNYKEGTYFARVASDANTVTAVAYVDESGVIKSLFIDTTYTKNDVLSTKKTLGDAYGMKGTSASKGVIEGGAEWDEQLEVLEKKILEEQDLDWLKWTDEAKTKTDSVAGVTVTIDKYYAAVANILEQAKK